MPVPEITILMGVHDGAAHLPAQLASLAGQDHRRWRLVASDDSPDDASRAVLMRFAAEAGQPVEIRIGPRAGFAANYMQLIASLPEAPGLVAFADQDDVWLPGKLARAEAALRGVGGPALYCARSFLWDGAERRRASPAYPRPPGFRNALIENIAQGNTILLNAAGAALARVAAPQVRAVFAHDWWLYLLITGAGGAVIVDNGPPLLLYRQHAGNQIGGGTGLAAQTRRKRAVMAGAFSHRLDLNIAALRACRACLAPENDALLEAFAEARQQALLKRFQSLNALGLYRQRPLATLGFRGASLLGLA